jgi:hypothetical protein
MGSPNAHHDSEPLSHTIYTEEQKLLKRDKVMMVLLES